MISADNQQVTFTYNDNIYDYTVLITYICESESSNKNGLWFNNFSLMLKNNNTNKAYDMGICSLPINDKVSNDNYPFTYRNVSIILFNFINNIRYDKDMYILEPHDNSEIKHILLSLDNIANDTINLFGRD